MIRKEFVLAVSVILAICAFVAFIIYTTNLDKRTDVVIAAIDLKEGDVISKTSLSVVPIHPDNVVNGASKNVDAFVGKQIKSDVFKGEQLTASRLTETVVITEDFTLAEALGRNNSAVILPVELLNFVGGQPNEGDKVAIYRYDFAENKMMLAVTDVTILKIVDEKGLTKGEYLKQVEKDRDEFTLVGIVLETTVDTKEILVNLAKESRVKENIVVELLPKGD